MIFLSDIVYAADKAVKRPGAPHIELPSIWGYTFKIILSLLVVLGVILLFFYILKKIKYGAHPFHKDRKIEVIETVSLMGKWAVALIKVGSKYFLIGLSGENVNLISCIDEQDLEDKSFSKILREESETD